jgi:hypothetical protein
MKQYRKVTLIGLGSNCLGLKIGVTGLRPVWFPWLTLLPDLLVIARQS